VFCWVACRHRGERRPGERVPVDRAAVARLFDEARDPDSRVLRDDWHPGPSPEWVALDIVDTVETRRRWYRELEKLGRL
jgi:hypothetical protein